jgi:biofilm PGA synthesis N-glycosyltransferase PgaC
MESDIHSVPGATGAILALRRSEFRPLRPGTLLDDVVLPMRVVLAGHRSILDSQARAYDVVEKSAEREYGRKRRTLAGNYQILVEMPELLAPWRNPIFLQFISHKVGRLLIPYCLAALFISNAFLLSGMYLAAFIAQLLWYGMAAAGWLISARGPMIDGTVPPSPQIRSRV